MDPYGEFCALTLASEVLADRWTPLIVRELLAGHTRFNELHRRLPRISRSILSDRLRRLEREGLVYRRVGRNGRTSAYLLTPAGREADRVVESLRDWGKRWVLGVPRPQEMDPAMVLWWLRRRIDRSALPERRVVVRFDFSGARSEKLWLVLEREEISVCLQHPGFEENLVVRADVAAVFAVWLGTGSLEEAMDSEALQIEGPPRLARAFAAWVLGTDAAEAVRAAVRAS